MCVWQVQDWILLRVLKGHKGSINSFAVHPSGKLAVTVGRDKTVRTWNLLKGRSLYVHNRKTEVGLVRWSPQGTFYLLAESNLVEIYVTESGEMIHSVRSEQRIHSVSFFQNATFGVGLEDGSIGFYNVSTGTKIFSFSSGSSRVRDISVIQAFADSENLVLISSSSDGHIKVRALHHVVSCIILFVSLKLSSGLGIASFCNRKRLCWSSRSSPSG